MYGLTVRDMAAVEVEASTTLEATLGMAAKLEAALVKMV